MTKYLEPLEVIVHPLVITKSRLLFEPLVVSAGKLRKGVCPYLLQLAKIIIQVLPFDLMSRPLTQDKSSVPFTLLLVIQITLMKSCCLITYFRRCNVQEERAYGITLRVIQVI